MKLNTQLFQKEVTRVVVAMSGGVDSSVAALLLHQAGFAAVGISMQVWDYRQHGGCDSRATCCSPDDFTDARKVAASIGVPYYVFDFEQTFRKEVIDKFVRTYAAGETPNPCVDCNAKVKFKELRERAKAFGCSHVATGHYARIEKTEAGFHLLRANDVDKDQSYFLYNLTQSELKETIFPIGDYTKPEVREFAREAELATASKPESQDICFVKGSVQDFLVKLGGSKPKGKLIRRDGTALGNHEGIHAFTVGQRKGLGIGGTEVPLYVLEIRPATNEVVVGEREELEKESFKVGELTFMSPSHINIPHGTHSFEALAQVRHRHKGVKVGVNIDSGTAVVSFKEDWTAVSPGQACVFYSLDNREVLGGGRIIR